MFTIIGGDQKQYGPVTADEVRQWIRDGRADGRTLARSEESPEWKPLASFPEFAAFTTATGVPPRLPGATVAPGVISSVPGNFPKAAGEEILAGEPDFDMAECLGRAWELWINNFGLLTGACLLTWLLELVPLLGPLFSGVLYGGLYLIFLKRIRGEAASVGEALSGFGNAFLQLFLAGFISALLTGLSSVLCMVPWIYFKVAWVFCVPLVMDNRLEFWTAMELSRKVVGRVWLKMFGLVVIAFAPTILIKGFTMIKIDALMSDALNNLMAHGQPDLMSLVKIFMDVGQKMAALSALSLVVLLVNLPFATGALMYAYENLFRSRPAPTR